MKKSKVFMIMTIALIAVVAVGAVSFAAWSNLKGETEGLNVGIGKQVNLVATTDLTGAETGKLVPEGAITVAGNVTSLKMGSFTVALKEGETNVAANNATVKMYAVVKDGEEVVDAGIFTVTVGANAISQAEGTASAVTFVNNALTADVTIKFTADAATADTSIASKDLTVTIYFVATVA